MKINKVFSLVVVLVILQSILLGVLSPNLVVEAQGSHFKFLGSQWGSLTSPQKVYPGSSNVNLILFVRNDFGSNLVSVYVTLYLPDRIESYDGKGNITSRGYVQNDDSIRYYVNSGEVFQSNFLLNILNKAEAKDYNCTASIEFSYFSGSNYHVETENISVWFTVNDFPTFTFDFIESYWTTSAGYRVSGSSGARNLNLNFVLKNLGEDSINRIYAELDSGDILYPGTSTATINNVGKNEVFTLTFNQISIPISLAPGTYSLLLQLNCTFVGYGNAVNTQSYTIPVDVQVMEQSSPNLRLVKVSWRNYERAYPGSRAIVLDLTLQNFGEYTVSDTLIIVSLPKGFTDTYGKNMVNSTSPTTFGYGEFASFSVGPIYVASNVNPSVYYGNATVQCIGSRDGSQLVLSQNMSIPLIVSRYISNIDISTIEWLYNGQPAVALPGAQNIQLSITLVNRGEETLAGLTASLDVPSGFKLIGESVYGGTVPSASSFTLSFYFNISQNVKPGNYIIPLSLTFNVNPPSSNNIASSGVFVPVWVEDPKFFDSNLKVVNAFWGTVGNPIIVYPGSKFVPLTLEILNNGIYAVHGVHLKLYAPEAFETIIGESDLSANMPPGTFSTSTFYVNIKFEALPREYNLTLQQYYFISLYGAQILRTRNLTVQVIVFSPTVKPPYVKVVSSGWSNGYPVYPGTENATFNVVISNQAPYPISGVQANLKSLNIFTESGFEGFKAYVSGPIASWQTATLSFKLNVASKAFPGNYKVNMTIEYTLLSGGNNIRVREEHSLNLKVNALNGPEHVYSGWVRFSPGPGNKGALLLLVFRNNEVPLMRGAYVSVTLPKGFKSTVTGSNMVNVTPSSFSSTSQIQDIISLLSAQGLAFAQTFPTPQTQIGVGDLIAVPVQVDVEPDAVLGKHYLVAEFSFIDHWSNVQKTTVNASFMLMGSTNMIEIIEGKSRLVIGLRTSVIELFVKNNGTAPIKDVYVAIGGAPQGISVSSSIKYVPEIGPREEVNLSWFASVNPQTPYTGSLPILVVVSFADQLGNRRTFNQTAIVYVEGIVELKLMDTSVSPQIIYSGETLTVSTTILNLGTYKAKNVEANIVGSFLENVTGSYTFVGDVDVGAQVPVSLQARVKDFVGERTLYLVIRYRNVFNEPITQVYPVNVTVSPRPTITTSTAIPIIEFIDTYRVIFIILILGFLIASGILIYRLYQRAKRAAV
ncbi:MAG: hypothetical protein QXL89_00830 [Nitrososphaeria archaeon]